MLEPVGLELKAAAPWAFLDPRPTCSGSHTTAAAAGASRGLWAHPVSGMEPLRPGAHCPLGTPEASEPGVCGEAAATPSFGVLSWVPTPS